ncbi:MAG: phosphoribosylanthranilate isomerase [Candidatus Tectomicrobia bacterium]|uniref:N-(5'-phosphoribosyl)anthranilate isomerase n=1 Tax=Tectimicrobiota bacterium TaxID=2528274 RepID=A0A933GJ74_UNCTE|nr:phosphoribosylanthranilate isomerase [Candidatus Tectomicrobia bacterium]
MVRVKICGITNIEDALMASQMGVDALGFIFYPKSPRYVCPEAVREMVMALPPFVTTVGVFVNRDVKEISEIMHYCRLNVAQLHGEESANQCRDLPYKVIKAFQVKEEQDLKALMPFKEHVQAFLLDTKVKGLYGGTGQTFSWEIALKARNLGNIILAGGLNTENVKLALTQVNPYGVDISSGVEISPGRKDREKLVALMKEIREVTYGTR